MRSLAAGSTFLADMHHYPFHIKDYAAATAHLSNEEDLAYRRLLDFYYDTEAPIPKETDWVSRRLRVGSDVVSNVLQEFFIEAENGWIHARCDEEISAYKRRAEVARSNGKSGGRPKKTQRVPDRNLRETGSKANQEPRTNNQYIKTLSGKPDELPPSEKEEHPKTVARQLIDFLNAKAGKAFRHTDANLEPILARFKEGYSMQDLKTVTARKCREWAADEKMAQYLRPATLYNRTKFNQYIGECVEE